MPTATCSGASLRDGLQLLELPAGTTAQSLSDECQHCQVSLPDGNGPNVGVRSWGWDGALDKWREKTSSP